jgi:dynactin-4
MINQRLANPEFQVDKCNKLYPLNKFFVTKESKRCNVCDHNVIKPENNITSIKFKLHQVAL